jgi:hypothetical protein
VRCGIRGWGYARFGPDPETGQTVVLDKDPGTDAYVEEEE